MRPKQLARTPPPIYGERRSEYYNNALHLQTYSDSQNLKNNQIRHSIDAIGSISIIKKPLISNLRNQITNLKSEVNKLLQINQVQSPKESFSNLKIHKTESLMLHQRKQNAPVSQITHQPSQKYFIENGFYDKNSQKVRSNLSLLNEEYPSQMETKMPKRFSLYENRNLETNIIQQEYNRIEKEQTDQTKLRQNKIKELEIEIRKLGQLKYRADQECISLKQLLRQKELIYNSQHEEWGRMSQANKAEIDQLKISLSLKNRLVQKLESDLLKDTNESSSAKQQIILNNQQEKEAKLIIEAKNKQLEELLAINQFQSIQVKQVVDDLKQNGEEIRWLKQENDGLREQRRQKQCLQKHLWDVEVMNKDYQSKNIILQQALTKQQILTQNYKQMEENSRLLEAENLDLKKRVELYRKSLESMNSSNNASREKQAHLMEQNKGLVETTKTKQKLINSLYNDIGILDREIRQSESMKRLVKILVEYIDDLSQQVLSKSMRQLNRKYEAAYAFELAPILES